jgi:MerR family transcriptional regulator/heat shock protein HspR
MVNQGWADLDRGLFSISVAAELAGLHPQTLRIYEREGLLDPVRSAGGTRRYSRRDIDRLAEICSLTADGLNLAGIRRVLQMQEETRQLQVELARLRDLAGGRAGNRQTPGPPRRSRRAGSPRPPRLAAAPPALAGAGAESFAQAGGQGALGGQVVFQGQDAQRGGQGMTLVEHLPDPRGEGQLAARVAAAPARRPLRSDRARGVQGAQERLPHPQHLGGPAGGIRRVIRVVQVIKPGRHRGKRLLTRARTLASDTS